MDPKNPDGLTAGEVYTYLHNYVFPAYYECAISKDKLIDAVQPKNNK